MNINLEQIRLLTELQGLKVPHQDLLNIAIRFSTWMSAMEQIEKELEAEINAAEPIPPVYPREEF